MSVKFTSGEIFPGEKQAPQKESWFYLLPLFSHFVASSMNSY